MKTSFCKILICGLFIIVIPQFTLAVWWKPATWFNNSSVSSGVDEKTLILERRIAELERRLEAEQASSTISAAVINSIVSKQIATSTSVTPKTSKKITDPIVVRPPLTGKTSDPVAQIPQRDYKTLYYSSLIPKYVSFRDNVVELEFNRMANGVRMSQNETQHFLYLSKLNEELNIDIAEISKLNPLKYDYYVSEYSNITSEYNKENDRYNKAVSADFKQQVIEFAGVNRDNLILQNNHIKFAQMLDQYDRTFGTKYSDKFRLLDSSTETIEFVNSFLLDNGIDIQSNKLGYSILENCIRAKALNKNSVEQKNALEAQLALDLESIKRSTTGYNSSAIASNLMTARKNTYSIKTAPIETDIRKSQADILTYCNQQ